jgi:undecaprenyl-diphosphatase
MHKQKLSKKQGFSIKKFLFFLIFSSFSLSAFDYKLKLDDTGFWGAHYDVPKYSLFLVAGMALYEGTDSRIGKTAWQSLDAGLMSQVLTEGVKYSAGRLRPRNTDSPNDWGQGGKSFFSGHVSGMTALVTPFVLEYQEENPWVHLLWALPLYQMEGRLKAQAHWQSDVIAGAIVGFASGYWASKRKSPLLLYFTEGNLFVGFKQKF